MRRFPDWADFLPQDFGTLLRAARVSVPSQTHPGRSMSQEELAEAVGLDHGSTISNWERGKTQEPPPRDVVMRLEQILGVSDYRLLLAAGYHPLPIADLSSDQIHRLSRFLHALLAEDSGTG